MHPPDNNSVSALLSLRYRPTAITAANFIKSVMVLRYPHMDKDFEGSKNEPFPSDREQI